MDMDTKKQVIAVLKQQGRDDLARVVAKPPKLRQNPHVLAAMQALRTVQNSLSNVRKTIDTNPNRAHGLIKQLMVELDKLKGARTYD
jgi:hypothetical protein